MNTLQPAALAKYIDHTLLAPDATREQIRTLCEEAQAHGFYSVCLNSGQVPYAASCLTDNRVVICAVVGFPLGAGLSDSSLSSKPCRTRAPFTYGKWRRCWTFPR